jgi:hypothetical protein
VAKQNKKMQKMADFQEAVYQLLRDYQDGKFSDCSQGGVMVGALDIPLTKVYDGVLVAMEKATK